MFQKRLMLLKLMHQKASMCRHTHEALVSFSLLFFRVNTALMMVIGRWWCLEVINCQYCCFKCKLEWSLGKLGLRASKRGRKFHFLLKLTFQGLSNDFCKVLKRYYLQKLLNRVLNREKVVHLKGFTKFSTWQNTTNYQSSLRNVNLMIFPMLIRIFAGPIFDLQCLNSKTKVQQTFMCAQNFRRAS